MSRSWPLSAFTKIVADETGGNLKTLQSDYKEAGRFPIIDQGRDFIAGYTDDASRLCKAKLPVVIFGDHTRAFKFVDFPFCLGADGTKVLRPGSDLDPKYLYHFLSQVRLESAGYSRHFKFLKDVMIPLPPLDEQRRIAAILDQADALRRKRREASIRLSDLSSELFKARFGDPENERALKFANTLGHVVEVQSGSTPSRDNKDAWGGHIPWVKTGEVNGSIIHYTEEGVTDAGKLAARLRILPTFTILIAMYGQGSTRGKVGMLGLPATINQACAALLPSEKLNMQFLFLQLKLSYERLRALGRGGNQPNLNLDLVRSFVVTVPPLIEQAEFGKLVERIERQQITNNAHLAHLDTLFASLQHRAFNGEL